MVAEVIPQYAEIPLTQGKVALVDWEDYDWLSQWKWHALRTKPGAFYAARRDKDKEGRPYLLMHREIGIRLYGPISGLVDHRDRDPLHNWRNNLRPCSVAQNNHNRGLARNNTSGYKGVHFHKAYGKWSAKVRYQGEKCFLGYFDTAEEAASAYNTAALRLFGEFAYLNPLDGGAHVR